MALKFLNKKGWHTGSLRNIENVWKAEQKHNEEERKLEELRKQIQEEREKSEFRQLQEQAGLIPRQERLDFLYDSGLACGKSSEGFKALEPKSETDLATAAIASASTTNKEKASAPGALFEEKPQSANDAWRKLHSDPLLLIRQREQEALARIKNNPVQMANIRKSVQEKKKPKEKDGKKKEHKKHSHKSSKHEKDTSSKGQSLDDDDASEGEDRRRRSQHYDRKNVEQYSSHGRSDSKTEEKRKRGYDKYSSKSQRSEDGDNSEREERKRRSQHYDRKKVEQYSSRGRLDSETEEKRKRGYDKYSLKSQHSEDDNASDGEERYKRSHHHDRKKVEHYSSHGRSDAETGEKRKRSYEKYSPTKVERSEIDAPSEREETKKKASHYDDRKPDRYSSRGRSDLDSEEMRRNNEKSDHERHSTQIMEAPRDNSERSHQRQCRPATKLSEEEKAARLREMQLDAELHEEQRWKRLKNASENDAREASLASSMGGRNFLEAAQSSVYGAEKGGSSTIEESVRRRKYYSQGQSESNNGGNAFRR